MKSKTIVLWGREDLLSTSVKHILTMQNGWKVVKISNEETLDTLIKVVDEVKPDVVIIHQGDRAGDLSLPTVLLRDYPGLKMIAVSLNDNLMEVYSKQNISVTSAIDLISVIKTDPIKLAKH